MLLASFVQAGVLKKEAQVPQQFQFVRSFDVDTYVGETNRGHLGMQTTRIRLRYLDPDVNAFVGMLAGFQHFNQDLAIGTPGSADTAGLMGNWGGDFGIVRGKHLWELDLMGTSLSDRLGFAMAIVGEHRLTSSLIFYHRFEPNLYVGDTVLNTEQGFYWMWKPWIGANLGYRWFTSQHMDRSGPYIGIRFYLQSPKIPFIFPSLG